MQNSPLLSQNRKQQYHAQERLQSPQSDKENNRSEVNFSQQHLEFKINQESLETLNEIAENGKTEESILDQNLTLFEKITHPKWQIRRFAYIFLSEQFAQNHIIYEFQQAWLKNIINDQNQFAVFEGIKFIDVFVRSQQMNYHILPYFVGDLLERGPFQKSQCQDLVQEILFNCCRGSSETSFVFQEIERKIESKHPKIMAFCLGFVDRVLSSTIKVAADQIRSIFQYTTALVQNTNKTIRNQAISIFGKIFSMVHESFETIRKTYLKDTRQIYVKELEQLCKKIAKKPMLMKLELGHPVVEIIDLHQLLPDKFFELPYYKQNERKNKIEQFAQNLEKYEGEVEANRDYGSIYNILITILEENNYLIYSVGMRCVKGIVKLLKKQLVQPVARHFFLLILDKLKGSLSKPLQSFVFNLLEDMLIFESISCDQFMELMIGQLELNKNLGQRVACLRWFKDGWLSLALAVQNKSYEQSDSEPLKKFAQNNADKISKSLLILYRKVLAINKKENNLNIKKACLELINSMEFNETQMVVTVVEVAPLAQHDQQESRIIENNNSLHVIAPLKLLKQKQNQRNRYQTEEDVCEFAQMQEEIQSRNRSSIDFPTTLNKDQVEFMSKFSTDLMQLKRLAAQSMEQHVQNKIDEIIQTFRSNCSDTDITGNDFLQQMTASLIGELSHFSKKIQMNKRSIVDKLSEFVISLLVRINKIQITLQPEHLVEQLKISIFKLQTLDHNRLALLLDSLYICCSLESMIKAAVAIVTKSITSGTIPRNAQPFVNWMAHKIQVATVQQLDGQFLRQAYKSFDALQKQLVGYQIDLRQILNVLNSRQSVNQSNSVDLLTDAYNDFVNQSMRKSKSKSIGSGSRFSPYETPNKTKSRLEFTSEEKEASVTFDQIEQQVLSNPLVLDELMNYLNKYRAHQLSNQSQHTVFLSPNSRSPGKHWRRGMGRENMIISTPGRHQIETQKFEDFQRILDAIGKKYSEAAQQQVYGVFNIMKHIFPQNIPNLIHLALHYISTQPHSNFEAHNSFLQNLMVVDKSIISYQYRLTFNQIYQQQHQEPQLVLLIQQGFMFIYYNILQENLMPNFPYYVTTLSYMLQVPKYQEFSVRIFNQVMDINKDVTKIIETELINYKKLYDLYSQFFSQSSEPSTPYLASFGKIDLQRLYQQHQEASNINIVESQGNPASNTSNQILIMDLQLINECQSKREETGRQPNKDMIQFNKEDFDLLESTIKNFQTSNTLRFHEDCSTNQGQMNADLLNLVSPLQHCSQVSNNCHDTVIQEIAKNLYTNDHQKQTLHELDQIKQLNESYRQHKRDSSKARDECFKSVQQSQEPAPTLKQHPQGGPEPRSYVQSQEIKYASQSQESFFENQQKHIQRIFKDVQNESTLNPQNRSLLQDVLAPIESNQIYNLRRNECIKHMQEVLLTSTSLYFDMANTLLQQYEILDLFEDKINFVNDLKLSIINETLLRNINEANFAVVISIVLRLCTSQTTQQEIYNGTLGYDDNQLTKALQLILDVLLHSKPLEQVLVCLIRVLNDHLPLDFNIEINRNERMMLRLNLKCIERLLANACELNVFQIFIEVLKFFKFHPPENLVEGLPQLKELELYFRQMKQISDRLIAINRIQAREFVDFIYRQNNKSIFLEYLKNAC